MRIMANDRSDFLILLVEDTPEMAQLTQLTLQRYGFESYHVADGDQAIAFLREYRPHLVLLDLNLPGISGWQVLEYMTDLYGEGSVPVIVTTAQGDSANRVIGKLQEVVRYLVKPFAPNQLAEAVEKALGIAS
jgi:two-component system alkaline phosphatase synthesis response regulator PhoP